MKKQFLLYLLITFCLILSSCAQPDYLLDERFHTEDPLPEFDMQNQFRGYRPVCESQDAIYTQPMDSAFLWYYDKQSKTCDILCGKPDCSHTDRSCNGYVEGFRGLSWYDNQIYWIDTDDSNGQDYVCRMNGDGTQRERIQPFQSDVSGAGSTVRLHRGYIYSGIVLSEVKDGKNTSVVRITQEKLGESSAQEPYVILESLYEFGATFYYQFQGNKMYLLIIYLEAPDAAHSFELYCFDVAKRSCTSLLSEKNYAQKIKDFWVERDGIYIAANHQGLCIVNKYDFASGSLNLVLSTEHPMGEGAVSLGEGVVVLGHGFGPGNLPLCVVMDYEGHVLLEKSLELKPGEQTFGFTCLGATRERVLYWWETIDSSGKNSSKIIAIPIDPAGEIQVLCEGGDLYK